MLTGHISFAAKVTSPAIQAPEPFDLDNYNELIEKATVDLTNVKEARIKIKFGQVESDELGRATAEQAARDILDGIAIRFPARLGEPRVTELGLHDWPEKPGTAYAPCVVAHAGVLPPTIHVGKMLTPPQVEELKAFLKQPDTLGKDEYRVFRRVLQCDDPVEEFMLHYSLLTAFEGGNQPAVDEFIRQHEPGVEERTSPHTSKNETIYTCLRNEVGHHTRSKLKPAEIRREMQNKLPDLRKLVQKAIEERRA
jgi:hypothetical protein